MNEDKCIFYAYLVCFLVTCVWYFFAAFRPNASQNVLFGGLALGLTAGFVTFKSQGFLRKWFWLFLLIIVSFVQICSSKTTQSFQNVLVNQLLVFIPFGLVLLINAIPMKEILKQAINSSILGFAFFILSPVLYDTIWENSIQMSALLLWISIVFLLYSKGKTRKESAFILMVEPLLVCIMLIFNHLIHYFINWIYLILFLLFIAKYCITNKYIRISTICFIVSLFVITTMFLSQNIDNYLLAKYENDSRIMEPYAMDFTFVTKEGEVLNIERIQGKNLVIFFWSKRCKSCHEEMPFFSNLTEEYEKDSTTMFVAAFVSFEENDTMYYETEIQQNYAFKWAWVCNSKQVMQNLNFNSFPHLTILNKEGEVVYNGIVSNRPWIFVNNPRKHFDK